MQHGRELPPPAPGLAHAVGELQPVRTRVPAQTVLLIASAALVVACTVWLWLPLRDDRGGLPAWWFLGVAVVWAAGFATGLTAALLPRRGQVLPDAGRAARVAALVAPALLLGAFLLTPPGRGGEPRAPWWPCVRLGLLVAIPVLALMGLALRRIAMVGAARLGAAAGAATGALAGLVLHGVCASGAPLHLGPAHGGLVAFGAIAGAAWTAWLARS
jgi:hypothetical protein